MTSRSETNKALSDLSRNGWANAKPCDYEPLEAKLRPVEELTPEGVQLVIPGTEKVQPVTMKQGELW